jgi:hypothetical protein
MPVVGAVGSSHSTAGAAFPLLAAVCVIVAVVAMCVKKSRSSEAVAGGAPAAPGGSWSQVQPHQEGVGAGYNATAATQHGATAPTLAARGVSNTEISLTPSTVCTVRFYVWLSCWALEGSGPVADSAVRTTADTCIPVTCSSQRINSHHFKNGNTALLSFIKRHGEGGLKFPFICL